MINKNYTPQAVILANGEYPSHPLPLRMLQEAPYVVCCDGAANEYIAHGHTPDLIIGDGDSLSAANKKQFASRIHHVADQETNDQTKAVLYLQQQGIQNMLIVGATGKREDHTLGNISLLIEYLKQGIEVRMITDYGTFIPAKGEHTFAAEAGQQVSIFNFGATGMQAEGLVYPISDFSSWWQGTLNEATSNSFVIRCSGYYLIFLAYPTAL